MGLGVVQPKYQAQNLGFCRKLIYIYMEKKVENQEAFGWRRVEETVELAFEEHPHASATSDDPDIKNHEIHNVKKIEHDDVLLDSDIHIYHQEGSKEIFDGHQYNAEEPKLTATIETTFDRDLANNVHITVERSTIPPILVNINPKEIIAFEEAAAGRDWKLVVEVMFAERSHSSQHERYKIFKGGIAGSCRKKFIKSETIDFRNLKINYHSTVDKNSKIVIALYYFTDSRKKIFRQVLLSKDLFIVQQNKLLNVDTEESLRQYFDLFGSEFMDKLPTPVKINKSDKHSLHEEIQKLEQYLLKKNKRFLNIVFLSFKFPHFCELYFRLPPSLNQNESPEDFMVKKTALSNCLTEAIKEVEELKPSSSKPEMLCNYTSPKANLIFRINVNLRKVRIFVKKEFSDILSIIVSDEYQDPEGFAKFYSAKELKDFYLEYYSYARKCKSTQSYKGGHGHYNTNSAVLNTETLPKKSSRKAEDDDYHEDEGEDEEESEGEEDFNEGYSGDKKAKKQNILLKRLYAGTKKPSVQNTSPKESKYPTRGKTRAQDYQDSSNNQSKRNTLNKKVKEKEIPKKLQQNIPIMTPAMGMTNPMNPMMPFPFQVMQGGSAGQQNPMLGVFPMMQNAQNKDPKQPGGPAQKGPQIAAIPMGMQGLQGLQGMQAMQGMPMLGGFPGAGFGNLAGIQGMPGAGFIGVPGATGQQGQKKDGKDNKEDGSGSGAPKIGMPMMMPMLGQGMGMPFLGGGGSPSICMMNQNGQLIPMGQMGMPGMMGQMPGMQGVPMAMQGPNGQTIMMMPMVSSQMMQSAQQSQQTNSSQPQQAQGLQSMMTSMPMGMMMPGGAGGMQGMMLPQSMMGLLGAQGQMAMGSTSGQPGTAQIPGLGFGQGMPMGFMMPQTGQPQQKQKNGNPQATKSVSETTRRVDSGRKEDKPDNYSAQIAEQVNSQKPQQINMLPSFLSPGTGQQTQPTFNPQQKQTDKINGQKTTPSSIQPPAFGSMGMPNGMMLTPEMLQQMGMSQQGQNQGQQTTQGGQAPQVIGAMSGMPGMGGMSSMSGISGMGGLGTMAGLGGMGGLPQVMSMINPQMLPPQQRQAFLQQLQAMGNKMPNGMNFPPGMFGKKDEDKK